MTECEPEIKLSCADAVESVFVLIFPVHQMAKNRDNGPMLVVEIVRKGWPKVTHNVTYCR